MEHKTTSEGRTSKREDTLKLHNQLAEDDSDIVSLIGTQQHRFNFSFIGGIREVDYL